MIPYVYLDDVREETHPFSEVFFKLRVKILVVETVEDLHEKLEDLHEIKRVMVLCDA